VHLLFVGQLSAIKGAGDFVAALGQIRELPWQASMVGDGPERAGIEAEIKALGLDQRIKLHGYVARKNLAGIYRRASLLVFPTFAPESLGMVGIEAMWFGIPVVAYDVGAIREWLQTGKNGYLVKPGEIRLMADCIRSLLENKPQLESFRLQARNSARHWLDANRVQLSFNELYLNVIEGNHANRH
jgi:glycosyltransferase involved in cell wall biosynthesis